ncbi:MAG TPA: hypothetical protein VGI39_30530 [Polyangiaceae bacterium]
MATNRNTVLTADKCAQRIQGLNEHLTAKSTLTINQEPMKLADVIATYQTALDARTTLKSKRAEVKLALQEWKDADAAQTTLDKGLKVWVEFTYGLQSQESQDIGFSPPKRTKPTVETKAQALLQSKATRKARGTMGKKEKAKIKGIVPTAPAAPAPQTTSTASAPAPTANVTNGAAPAATSNGTASAH